tara:strand:+ start:61 stop:564 length:504 start_codon:yes stop_codon:yes gene_type:complete
MINIIINCILIIYNWLFDFLRTNRLLVLRKRSKPKLKFLDRSEPIETMLNVRSDINKLFERIGDISTLEDSIKTIDTRIDDLHSYVYSPDPYSFEKKLEEIISRMNRIERLYEERKLVDENIDRQVSNLTIKVYDTSTFVNTMNKNIICLKKILYSLTGRDDSDNEF